MKVFNTFKWFEKKYITLYTIRRKQMKEIPDAHFINAGKRLYLFNVIRFNFVFLSYLIFNFYQKKNK